MENVLTSSYNQTQFPNRTSLKNALINPPPPPPPPKYYLKVEKYCNIVPGFDRKFLNVLVDWQELLCSFDSLAA